MPERNELITVCRQIGGMMEAGVDILRITRVLRAQTDTPRLLQLYDSLDKDLTMGRSLAEAMSRAPDVFSPFAVQMIQQGEARNDLAGAFLKVADFLKQELEEDTTLRDVAARDAVARDSVIRDAVVAESSTRGEVREASLSARPAAPDLLPTRAGTASPLTVIALDGLMDRLQTFMLRALTITAGLMLSLASVWWLLELGYIEKRWELPLAFSMTAVFLGGAGIFIQRRIRADRRREARCSFCGRQGIDLQRAPRFAGAAICSRCAAIVAKNNASDAPTTASDSSATDSSATDSSADSPDSSDLKSQELNHKQPIDNATHSSAQAYAQAQAQSSAESEAGVETIPDATKVARDDLNYRFSNGFEEKAERDASDFVSRDFADRVPPISPHGAAATEAQDAKSVRLKHGNRAQTARAEPLLVDEEDYE